MYGYNILNPKNFPAYLITWPGAYLKGSNYWASFSIPRLFNVKRNKDLAIIAKDRFHAYLILGADFAAISNIYFKPSLILRKVKGLPATAD